MQSLRNKILSTYGYSKLVMLAFAVVVFVDLHLLNRHIQIGQGVADFREATLEMRRDEKNLFLYEEISNLDQLKLQVDAASGALTSGKSAFIAISGEPEFNRIETLLRNYVGEIMQYPRVDAVGKAKARDVIRELGRDLVDASEEISRRERHKLAEATRRAGLTLMLAFGGVVLLGLAGGLFLVRRVVSPLGKLEEGLRDINEGRARELSLPSRDQEIHSFVDAFNAMIKHMRRQQDQAKRNEKAAALGILVSGVAHELNNPLSNISTSAQLLLEEGEAGDAEMKQLWLSQIDSETERARRIVRRLLESVRHPKLYFRRIPLADLIQSSLVLVNNQLPADVQVCVGTTADLEIAVDRERMHQVFINLIKNAADAGSRHISVSGCLAPWDEDIAESALLEGDPAMIRQADQVVRIVVEDDGPGMTPEVREHIFDPFFTTRSTGDGTGLGLYLVDEIISEHRGCIVVDNPAVGGTRFSIWLPLDKEKTQ